MTARTSRAERLRGGHGVLKNTADTSFESGCDTWAKSRQIAFTVERVLEDDRLIVLILKFLTRMIIGTVAAVRDPHHGPNQRWRAAVARAVRRCSGESLPGLMLSAVEGAC
jgi:hypothetical protein